VYLPLMDSTVFYGADPVSNYLCVEQKGLLRVNPFCQYTRHHLATRLD
jgi:hypothetical protein